MSIVFAIKKYTLPKFVIIRKISMDNRYSSLLGITLQEMEIYFKEYINLFAEAEDVSNSELIKKIIYLYNGFCFSGRCEKVFNPFSMLLLFDNLRFSNYWFESATPSFLIKLIKEKNLDIKRMKNLELREENLSLPNLDKPEPKRFF